MLGVQVTCRNSQGAEAAQRESFYLGCLSTRNLCGRGLAGHWRTHVHTHASWVVEVLAAASRTHHGGARRPP